MAVTLSYVQNQTYEGILATCTKGSDGLPLDISGLTEAVFRIFLQDHSALLFTGSKTGGEVFFVNDGTDGKIYYDTQAGDMDPYGLYRAEVEITLGTKLLKKQDFLVDIKRESPTT